MTRDDKPLVSIIIPNYNYELYLREAIDSALNQTYEHVEVIVVDNGSTDSSKNIIQSYGNRITSLFFQRNTGPSSARNSGVEIASGKYLIFLDSDDVLVSDAVMNFLHEFEGHPDCGIVFGKAELVGIEGATAWIYKNMPRYLFYEQFVFKNYILIPAAAMVKRNTLNEAGMFNPHILQCEDYELWLRISKKFTLLYVDKVVAKVRKHGTNYSQNTISMLTWELDMKLSHYDHSNIMKKAISNVYHRLAYEHRIVRHTKLFRQYALQSIKYNPFYWKNYAYLVYSWLLSPIKK